MKHFTMMLAALMLLSLLGCGANESAWSADPSPEPAYTDGQTGKVTEPETQSTEEVTESETQSTEEVTSISPSTEEMMPLALGEDDKGPAAFIYTDYYSLKAPISWGNTGLSKTSSLDNGGYSLAIYEYDSFIDFGGGKLCTLMMFPSDDMSYKDLPDYELLCALDTPKGCFYVVALFPTDVQFTVGTMETYNTMYAELMDVLYSIRPVGEIEMAMQ